MSASPSSESAVSGLFFDGKRSQGFPAQLSRQDQALCLSYADQSLVLAASALRLGVQVGKARSYLSLEQGGVFESADQAGLMALARAARVPGAGGALQRLEGNLRLILISAAIVLAVLAGSLVYGIPWLSKVVANQIPVSMEVEMGKQTLEAMERLYMSPSQHDDARLDEVRGAFEPYLAAFAERHPEQSLTVLFRDSDTLGANAFALPGGIVVFTDDLLTLAEQDEELIAILAHEVGHVVHRHSLRSAIQSSLAL